MGSLERDLLCGGLGGVSSSGLCTYVRHTNIVVEILVYLRAAAPCQYPIS